MSVAKCRAPHCNATKLCRAHIIPQGFARPLSEADGHNKAVRSDGAKPANQPLGPFDLNILCSACDNALGVFDEYAINFCASLPTTGAAPTGSHYRRPEFNGPTFARAILAIVWRASISAREEWAEIALGRYEPIVGDILYGLSQLSDFPEIEIALLRYASADHDARKFIFNPLRIRSGNLNVFSMGLGGFQVLAKIDQRPFHEQIRPYVVNTATSLTVLHVRFEETAEYAFFKAAAQADRRRRTYSDTSAYVPVPPIRGGDNPD